MCVHRRIRNIVIVFFVHFLNTSYRWNTTRAPTLSGIVYEEGSIQQRCAYNLISLDRLSRQTEHESIAVWSRLIDFVPFERPSKRVYTVPAVTHSIIQS